MPAQRAAPTPKPYSHPDMAARTPGLGGSSGTEDSGQKAAASFRRPQHHGINLQVLQGRKYKKTPKGLMVRH